MIFSYYDKIMKTWAAGKILDAQSCFKKGKKEKLLSQEETEKLDKLVIDWGAIIVQECLEDPKVAYNLYENLLRVTRWDDET